MIRYYDTSIRYLKSIYVCIMWRVYVGNMYLRSIMTLENVITMCIYHIQKTCYFLYCYKLQTIVIYINYFAVSHFVIWNIVFSYIFWYDMFICLLSICALCYICQVLSSSIHRGDSHLPAIYMHCPRSSSGCTSIQGICARLTGNGLCLIALCYGNIYVV